MHPTSNNPNDAANVTPATPPVEFGPSTEHDEKDEKDHWLVFAGIALFFFAIAGFLLFPGNWQEYIESPMGGRYGGFYRFLANIGLIPTVIVLAALGIVSLLAVVKDYLPGRKKARDRKRKGDNRGTV